MGSQVGGWWARWRASRRGSHLSLVARGYRPRSAALAQLALMADVSESLAGPPAGAG